MLSDLLEQKRKDYESFNDHQKDNRGRVTQLSNYAFILAGGSFTASVTAFVSQPKEQITPIIVHLLHTGWYNLFLAMASFFSMLTVMVFRDYFVAEIAWRPKLIGKKPYLNPSGKPYLCIYVFFEIALFTTGLFGFGTLIYGLYKIMEAACALIG